MQLVLLKFGGLFLFKAFVMSCRINGRGLTFVAVVAEAIGCMIFFLQRRIVFTVCDSFFLLEVIPVVSFACCD